MINSQSQYINVTSMPAMVRHLTCRSVSAMVMLCSVTDQGNGAVAAFIVSPDPGREEALRHAIDMEISYSDSELSFDDAPPPYYGVNGLSIDFDEAASVIGVDRVLCLVIQEDNGRVNAVRDYDGLEVTMLEAVKTQLVTFRGMLPDASPFRGGLQ